MSQTNILITGASGKLGKALVASSLGKRRLFTPSHTEMDITNGCDVEKFLRDKKIDSVIHCAALASVLRCENDPAAAIETNMLGTNNIVHGALKLHARLIYLSTDYVYPCTDGSYSENDSVAPFTVYGWTKLGGECAAKIVKNHCVIRTSFFEPNNILFDDAPFDSFCSKIPLPELVEAIIFLLDSDFVGTVNVGQERASAYDILKKYKPNILPVSLEEISKKLSVRRAVDSSLDVRLWRCLFPGQHLSSD